ncbi:MAG: hypothetical protein KDK45_22500, partial [Leptospiraceae bacterium]|nr:hypothetical protein [Leptospiraceae bacterium]
VQYYEKNNDIPSSRAKLFDGFIEDFMIKNEEKQQGVIFDRKIKDELLKALGFALVKRSHTLINESTAKDIMFRRSKRRKEWKQSIYFKSAEKNKKFLTGVREYKKADPTIQKKFDRIYQDILHNGVIERYGAPGKFTLEFAHQSIGEYYSAYILAHKLSNNPKSFYKDIQYRTWIDAVRILVGFVIEDYKEPISEFLKSLPDKDLSFMVECLLNAEYVEDDVKMHVQDNLHGKLDNPEGLSAEKKEVLRTLIKLQERWPNSSENILAYLDKKEMGPDLITFLLSELKNKLGIFNSFQIEELITTCRKLFSEGHEKLHEQALECLKKIIEIEASDAIYRARTSIKKYILKEFDLTFDSLRKKYFSDVENILEREDFERLVKDEDLELAMKAWGKASIKKNSVQDDRLKNRIEFLLRSEAKSDVEKGLKYIRKSLAPKNAQALFVERLLYWYDQQEFSLIKEWISNTGNVEVAFSKHIIQSFLEKKNNSKTFSEWVYMIKRSKILLKADLIELLQFIIHHYNKTETDASNLRSAIISLIKEKELFPLLSEIGHFAFDYKQDIRKKLRDALQDLRKSDSENPPELHEVLSDEYLPREKFEELLDLLYEPDERKATLAMFTLSRMVKWDDNSYLIEKVNQPRWGNDGDKRLTFVG